MSWLVSVLILLAIYAILALSLEILVGQTGLLSLAHAGFFGIGAYTSALVADGSLVASLGGVALGGVVAVGVSLLVASPSARLRGDYFAIATLGFHMVIYSAFNNLDSVTRGPLGISGIPELPDKLFLVFAIGGAVIAGIVLAQVMRSPFGRVLRAIREDEMFVRALGKRIFSSKLTAFGTSAFLASIAGSLYAHYVGFVDPSAFTVMESILILSMVLIGGAGSLFGPVLGAGIFTMLPELLRFVGISDVAAPIVREIIFGALLVIILMYRPQGLLGQYRLGS